MPSPKKKTVAVSKDDEILNLYRLVAINAFRLDGLNNFINRHIKLTPPQKKELDDIFSDEIAEDITATLFKIAPSSTLLLKKFSNNK